MPYTSAILGCGKRAVVHAEAYGDGLPEIELRAICDVDPAALGRFGERFNVARRYQRLEEMLEAEHPDILHVVTMPQVREEPIETAALAGVRGIIVEKPLGLRPSQADRIRRVAERTGVKIALNTQRRYFPGCQDLRRVLEQRRIGELLFARVVTKGNILSMGPHMVDLLLYFLGDVPPVRAWACANGMNGYQWRHPAPANMMIRYIFPDGFVAYCEDADDCIGTPGETNYFQHLEYNFWGSQGRAWWTQNRDWGYITDGMAAPHVEPTCWGPDDAAGQREFTRAMADWLDDGRREHLNCLRNALAGFDMIMAALQSAWLNEDVAVPAQVSDDLPDKLEERLKA